jgi:hypothetical protein
VLSIPYICRDLDRLRFIDRLLGILYIYSVRSLKIDRQSIDVGSVITLAIAYCSKAKIVKINQISPSELVCEDDKFWTSFTQFFAIGIIGVACFVYGSYTANSSFKIGLYAEVLNVKAHTS